LNSHAAKSIKLLPQPMAVGHIDQIGEFHQFDGCISCRQNLDADFRSRLAFFWRHEKIHPPQHCRPPAETDSCILACPFLFRVVRNLGQ
jgi:hypothetical protein